MKTTATETILLKRWNRPWRFLPVILLFALLAFPAGKAVAATLRWTGGHPTSSDWSRGANWDTGTAPVNGDTLVFPAGAARLVNNNDLTGLQVAVIRFNGASGGYTLTGNGVTVTDAITANHTAGGNTIALARITLANAMSFSVNQPATSLVIESEVRLGGNNLTADTTGFLVLQGVISGNGDVLKMGDSLLTLSGVAGNTFSGDLYVNAGTLFMGKSAGLAVPHRLVIGDGIGGSQADAAGYLADDQVNEVTINSSGLLNLGNFTDELSDLVLNQGGDVTTGTSGNLRLGVGANVTTTANGITVLQDSSTISGHLELLLGTHVFTVGEGSVLGVDSSDLVIDADINGFGGITKEGTGDLMLSGNNSFAANVNVNGGELRLGSSTALGGTVGVTIVNNDAGVQVNGGVAIGAEKLTLNSTGRAGALNGYPALEGIGTSSWAGDVAMSQDARVGVASGGHFTISGTIEGSGGLAKEGAGTLQIAGNAANNTYAGTTYVNAGTLELNKGTIGGVAVPGLLVIGDGVGGTKTDVVRHLKDNQVNRVQVNGSGFWDLGVFEDEVSELVLNEGGFVTTAATGNLRLGIGADVSVGTELGDNSGAATISGNLELLIGTHRFTVEDGSGTTLRLNIVATIAGLGAITKEGDDVLVLTGANSFAGLVTVEAGEVQVAHDLGLGSTLSGTRVNNHALLRINGATTIAGEALTLDSDGLSGLDRVSALLAATDVVWTGNVNLQRDTTISIGTSGSLEFTGIISGSGGMTKLGDGPLTFSGLGANTYTGITRVNVGRLKLNKTAGSDAVVGPLVIGNDDGGPNADIVQCLDIGQIGQASAVTVTSSGRLEAGTELIGSLAGAGNVTVSTALSAGYDNSSTTFEGVISGAGEFVKQGSGTLTFEGNNTYSGVTLVIDGELIVNGQQPSSDVTVGSFSAFPSLAGHGRVGNLSTLADRGIISPGAPVGELRSKNLVLTSGSHLRVELNGSNPGEYDRIRVVGSVNLGSAILDATLGTVPTLGQPLVIIDNDGTDPVVGTFDGLAEGATLRLNQVPFVISYQGGDGNDVTLVATNRNLSVVSTRVEAGNGNGVIDPNECDHLFIALMNETANPIAVSSVVLDSATPGVTVTQQRSGYANFPALGIRTNNVPFQFRTSPDFVCGRLIDFLLTVTVTGGGGGTFTIPVTVPSGSAGAPVQFDNPANLAIPDLSSAVSTITVASAAPSVGKVAVSLYLTHPSAGDLVLSLRSPAGTTVRLAANRGGADDNYGTGCGNPDNRTTFDDAAATKIAAGTAPFVGSFTPEESLAAFLGEDPNGDWQLLIDDTVTGDVGELRCWSLFISPPECSDGGGACESCVPKLTGRFNADMPSTLTRLVRNGIPSGCGSAKICPSVIPGPRLFYRVHLVTNSGPAACVSVVLNDLCRASNLRLHAAAYLGSYDPADPCANYLGDTGSELIAGSTSFSFAAPQDAVIAIVVSSAVTTTTCPLSYSVQLHGLPCPPPTLHISKTANPDEVRLHWSTAYPDFDLQRAPNLNGAAPYPFVNVPFTPSVVGGDYSVTNSTTGNDAYYRLRKP